MPARGAGGKFLSTRESQQLATLSPNEKLLTEELRRADDSLHLYQERLAELELQFEDWGWQRLNAETRREFSRAGLRIIADLCRIYSVKNPLIKNAVHIQRNYVFGQGISIVAKDEDVNEVIQEFLDDPKNQVELTSHQAIGLKETTLETEGNVFIVLFVNDSTGRVRVRSLPFDEINDIITDPDDRKTVRWYERTWTLSTFDLGSGTYKPETKRSFYPDWQYERDDADKEHPDKIGDSDVHWDQPVFHIKVGGLDSMRFGIPEVYAALDWAKATKQDLEDYATVKRALTRFATQLTTKGGPKAVAAAKAKMGTTYGSDPQNMSLDTNPSAVTGSMLIAAMGTKLEPFNAKGAQPDTNDAHGLWLMTATALGIPITMLSGDADAGNYATAKTLDRPTELKFSNRQRLWQDVLQAMFRYVIRCAIEAPSGALGDFGTVQYDDDGVWKIIPAADAEGEPRSLDIDIHFPDVVEHDPELKVTALVAAATLAGNQWSNLLPPKPWLQKLMQHLEFENVDEWMAKLYPEGSDDMELPAAALAAQQAAQEQALALKAAAPAPVVGKPGSAREAVGLDAASAAFQELRAALAPILARRGVTTVEVVEPADPPARSDMRVLAEAIAALTNRAQSTETTVRAMPIEETDRAKLIGQIAGLQESLGEAMRKLAGIPASDASGMRKLEESVKRSASRIDGRMTALEAHVAAIKPTTALAPVIEFSPVIQPADVVIEAAAPVAAPVVNVTVMPADVVIVPTRPKKTRTTVTKSATDGMPMETETETVEPRM
jgi:hypothetical protein